MTFQLGTIVDAASADVEIKHPATGRRIATVTVAGPEHPRRKAIIHARQRRLRQALAKTGKFDMPDPADEEADNVEYLVACTLGWADFADEKGEPLPFSAEAARRVYADPQLGWLRGLLLAALEERDRFISSSAAG